MRYLQSYLNEGFNELNEKLITFGNKAYPKFNNVVLLAGGAGSGKGFIIKNLLGIEGMQFDVDHLKELSLKSEKIKQRVKDELGYDLDGLTLKNPNDVALLHDILDSQLGIVTKHDASKFASILTAPKDRKPNLIFDTTLSRMPKLAEVTRALERMGYEKENTHLVWVINDVKVALKQNLGRNRVVPEDILFSNHRGASSTMREIVDMGEGVKKYLDGDIWFAFNNISSVETSDAGGMWIKDAHLVKVKDQGSDIKNIEKSITDKIASLVPKSKNW